MKRTRPICDIAPGLRNLGATTVEVALTLPVFFLILLMSVEAARLNTLRNTVENAAYEGARAGIVPGSTTSDVTTAVQPILNAVGAKSAVITTDPAVISDSATSITVTIDIPLGSNSWIGRTSSQHMIRSCTLTRERIK